MPATAGRVRMPHNNRMSTSATLKSSSIWQNAIGHDPYANAAEKEETAPKNTAADAEKLKNVMEMAKSQNITDGANRDDFTAKMYLGLKRGKQRRGDTLQTNSELVDPKLQQLLEDPSSSSEEEFVEVKKKKEEKKKSKDSKKHKKKKYSSDSSDSDSSSDDESDNHRREKKRRREKRKKRRRRHRDYSDDSSSSDSSDDDRRRKRKERRRRKEDRKKSSRRRDDSDGEGHRKDKKRSRR